MAKLNFLLPFLLLTLSTSLTAAVEYTVTNRAETTQGGIRFNNELGADYTLQTMSAASDLIWGLFQQSNEEDRKPVPRVPFFLDDMDAGQIAYSVNNEIHVGDDYIQNIQGDIKYDFNGVLYHEMTHVWQWDGSAGTKAPSGLIEGIADFVRLKANYAPLSGWVQPGQGNNWDDGYSVTARFLDYCNGLRDGVVAELNKKMRKTYSDDFWVELLGKSVDQLWSDYKAQYRN